jgi:ATP-dependent helicase/nuclease subunit B
MTDTTTVMAPTIIVSARAEERLARASAWLVAGGRQRETLVVGATALAARTLVRQVTATCGASFGWRPTTLGGLAVARAGPRLVQSGRAAAGAAILEGLTVRALHRLRAAGGSTPGSTPRRQTSLGTPGLGRLEPIADRPGLAAAVARTLAEVRLAGLTADALAAQAPELSQILGELAALLEQEKLADRASLLRAAAGAASATPAPALLLLDVPVWTALEASFVERLAADAPDTLATVPAGDGRTLDRLRAHMPGARVETGPAAGGALGRLQTLLFSDGVGTPAERGEEVVFLSAPGESRECVEIARRIVREAESGVPFDRMAVLLRGPAHYRAHLEEALRRARIPVHFSSGAVQPDPAGRAFLALLACLEEGLSARRFAEYLSLGEAPPATAASEPPPATPAPDRWVPPDEELLPATLAEPAALAEVDPPATPELDSPDAAVVAGTVRAPRRWEQILVDAAVIGGRARWQRRLAGWREELLLRRAEVEVDDPRGAGIERDLAQLDALRAFALPILEDLEALPREASWGVWLDRLAALATRTLRWPERVLAVLAELMPMAEVGPVGLREVRVVLARRLANLTLAPGSRSAGRVFVGPVATARGLAFDVVFVPGLAERMFPQRVGQDPLLRDEVRAALEAANVAAGPRTGPAVGLATLADRIEAERLALRIAVGSATRKVVLSYSRVDAEQARPRVPSFYGLEVLRAVEGRLPSFETLARTADRGGATRLGWPAPDDPADAIDEAEHDLALLARLVRPDAAAVTGAARYLITSNPHLARALRHRALRWDPGRWSYADGLVKPDEAAKVALAAHALGARSYSPTALQSYAACPYRFVLQALHKLAPREEPEAIEKIDPLDRGSLVHEVLFQLLVELRGRGLTPIRPDNLGEARGALERVLEEVAGQYRDRLAPAIDRVWEDGVASIRADLLESLRRQSEREPWSPWKLELAFGLPETRGRDPSSTRDPVALDCGIQLRGAIDLVEVSADGRLRATDHKTGKARQRPGSVIGGGESLQPVLYALALEKLFPDRAVDGGRLSYGTSAGDFKEVLVALDRRSRASAQQVAAAVGEALARGFLPAAPAKEACRYCDYRPVCGPWEEERTRRKQDRGDLTTLKTVRNLP